MTTSETRLMQCMEVWGGNQAVDGGVVMAGLDAWVYSQPFRGEVGGGDVYYVSSCATGRITRLLVADVSGHGSEVAGTGEKLRQLMRRYVNHIDQRRFVVALNREFSALSTEGRFATAVVATFFAPTRHISICSAGHPAPVLYRSRPRSWSLLEPAEGGPELANIPLGVADSSYYQRSLRLQVGDLLLCYTDPVIESRRGSGNLIGQAGLLEIARSLDPGRPQELIPALRAALTAEAPANLSGDDVTILVVRPNGLAPRLSWRQRLLAPLRLGRGLVRGLRPGGDPMPWPELSVANIGGAMFDPCHRRVGRRAESGEGP